MPSPTEALLRSIFDESPPADCRNCRSELYAYVDAELDGRDAEALFPGAHGHLRTCEACREIHEELHGLLALERDGTLVQPPDQPVFDFSYLPQPAKQQRTDPWHLDTLGRLIVRLSADLLQALQPPRLQPAHLKSDAAAHLFEISLAEALDDLQVTVRGETQRRRRDRLDLTVTVNVPSRGGWPHLAGSRVTLMRAHEVLEIQVTDAFGQAVFEGVPVGDPDELLLEVDTGSLSQSQ